MQIENIDDYLYEIRVRRVEYQKHYDKNFWRLIAEPWFKDIATAKAREYGFEAFLFLGPRAHIVDICGCHFRWRKLSADGVHIMEPSVLNALRDGFGYAVILSVMTGLMPEWDNYVLDNHYEEDPHEMAKALRNVYWQLNTEIDEFAVTIAHAIPIWEFVNHG